MPFHIDVMSAGTVGDMFDMVDLYKHAFFGECLTLLLSDYFVLAFCGNLHLRDISKSVSHRKQQDLRENPPVHSSEFSILFYIATTHPSIKWTFR